MLQKIKYVLPIAAMFLASCQKDFLDINTDPNNPISVEPSKLLPTAERNLGDALAIGGGSNGGLSQVLAVYTHQVTTREEPNQYGATGNEFYLSIAWPKLYNTVLQNLEDIILNGTTAGNLRYVGIAKILKAYTFSQLVDAFGDIPFSEANKLKQGIIYAKFDDDATIYPQLIALLDEGIGDLNNITAINKLLPGSDDVIYGGDKDKWVKVANTIKLKLYTQLRKVQNVSTEVTALINAGNLISTTSESFLLPYGENGATDDRNPGFSDYIATQRSNHISPWFYEILKGYNPNIHTGIEDPRIPYYFYNQLAPDGEASNPTEYRDGAFVSIYFGSVGPDRDHNQQNSLTVLGIYPVGGKFDDGTASAASAASGTGAAPYRFITYADRLYVEAELMKEGVIVGDARAKLQQAMEESFNQVDYVITQYVNSDQAIPALVGSQTVTDYIAAVLAEYDTGSEDKKLEIIMTQKWISNFGNAVDQYTDYRRTGYPILFNPADAAMAPGGFVQPPINGDPENPGAQDPVPVQLSRTYPLSLPWISGELETNPKAPAQKNPSTYKVFWMP